MQTLGLIIVLVGGFAVLGALSVGLYMLLPRTLLDCAERHGRFQGLQPREIHAQGTPAGDAPLQTADVLQGQAA